MQDRHFHELLADPHGGIQAGHRLLVDHGDLGAADFPQFFLAHGGQLAALELDGAGGDFSPVGEIPHDAEGDRGLAAAGLADQAHGLARHDLARKIHHGRDLTGADKEGDLKVFDLEDWFCHVRAPLSLSVTARAVRRPAGSVRGRKLPAQGLEAGRWWGRSG